MAENEVDARMDTVRKNTRMTIKLRSMTIRSAATKAGMSERFLQKFLTQGANMTLPRFLDLCEALDVKPSVLLESP